MNRSCIGCSVSFSTDSLNFIREVDGGSGHGSQSSKIYDLSIDWLGNEPLIIKNLKANKVYEVNENREIRVVYYS